jgi:circadian clock protein KaiC
VLTDHGAELADIFVGPGGTILTGSARKAQEAADRAAAVALTQDIARKQAALARKTKALEARIAEMQAELALEAGDVGITIAQQASAASDLLSARTTQAQQREQAGGAPRARTNGGMR